MRADQWTPTIVANSSDTEMQCQPQSQCRSKQISSPCFSLGHCLTSFLLSGIIAGEKHKRSCLIGIIAATLSTLDCAKLDACA